MKLVHFNLTMGNQIYKAFSDEARIRLLNLLHHAGQICISDAELVLDFTQTKTSRHFIYLKNSGIISFRKTDQFTNYYIKKEFSDIVGQLLRYMEKDALLTKDIETYRILYSNRELAANKMQKRVRVTE